MYYNLHLSTAKEREIVIVLKFAVKHMQSHTMNVGIREEKQECKKNLVLFLQTMMPICWIILSFK